LGLLHGWVQAGHDGLAQKAGFPQHATLEPCGSWFDPSNPVVRPGGGPHAREREWLAREAEQADLLIVVGVASSLPVSSSQCGAEVADWLITHVAERSTLDVAGGCLGTVVLGLQQTGSDAESTLRLFGAPNELLPALVIALGDSTPVASLQPLSWAHVPSMVLLPYTIDGSRTANGSPRMYLDLRPNAPVQLLGHNCQGARHPAYMHIGAQPGQRFRGRELDERAGPGGGYVRHRSPDGSWFTLIIEGVIMSIGAWWIEAAAAGQLVSLPVVNRHSRFEGQRPPAGPPIETIDIGGRARAEPLPAEAGDGWRGSGGEWELALLRESEALAVAIGGDAGEWGEDILGVGANCSDVLRGRRASKSRRPQTGEEQPDHSPTRARRASDSEPCARRSRRASVAGAAAQQQASLALEQPRREETSVVDECTSVHRGMGSSLGGAADRLGEQSGSELRPRSCSVGGGSGSAGTVPHAPYASCYSPLRGRDSPSTRLQSAIARLDDAAEQLVPAASATLASVASNGWGGGGVIRPLSTFSLRGASHSTKAIAELFRPADLRQLAEPRPADSTARPKSSWSERVGISGLEMFPPSGQGQSSLNKQIQLVAKYSTERNESSPGGFRGTRSPVARPHTANASTSRERAVRKGQPTGGQGQPTGGQGQSIGGQAAARAAVPRPRFEGPVTLADVLASAGRSGTGGAGAPLLVDYPCSPSQTSQGGPPQHHSPAQRSGQQARYATGQRQQ
jgi:hypothetical protein